MSERDEELEALLQDLAPTPEGRAQLLEEHRQLEKDLLRLADPLPPLDFVAQVMRKVEAAPAQAPARAEGLWALGILAGALALAAAAFLAAGGSGTEVALALTRVVVAVKGGLVGVAVALGALWRTGALPLTVALGGTLFFCLAALRRLSGRSGEARVRT